MPPCKYVGEIFLAAMLASKRSAGVTPEVNVKEYVARMPLPSMTKAAHSGFETQRNRGISGYAERIYALQKLKKKIGWSS